MRSKDISARRQTAERTGRRAETLCAWVLRLKGYRILARRARTPAGELDIVARRGRTLAFVEVKARAEASVAAASLGARQRRRITRAAAAFQAMRPGLAGLEPRFDVMLVPAGRLPVHIVNAWHIMDAG